MLWRSSVWIHGLGICLTTMLFLMATSPMAVAESSRVNVNENEIAFSSGELPATGLPRDALLISPIEGFTTAWHLAPKTTAIPVGTRLRFLRAAHPIIELRWHGAVEVFRDQHWSVAELMVDQPGRYEVRVDYNLPNHQVLTDRSVLRAVEISPKAIRVSPVRPTIATSDDVAGPPLEAIAKLTRSIPGRYATSRDRRLVFRVETTPAAFAPLIEWRLDGKPQLHTGPELALRFDDVALHQLDVGPASGRRTLEIQTYSVTIDEPATALADLAMGEPVALRAVTEPPGYEDEVRWLAIADGSSHVLAGPERGDGATFETRFLPLSAQASPEGFAIYAGDARLASDGAGKQRGFFATGRVLLSLDAKDSTCADGLDLELSSSGLAPTAYRLEAPPYTDGASISTELTHLELGAFHSEVGQLRLRLQKDRPGKGRIDAIVTKRGQMISGHSTLEARLEVELRDLGLSLVVGGKALSLDAGSVTRGLELGIERKADDGEPRPLLGPRGAKVGWLCNASYTLEAPMALDDTEQEEDWFQSVGTTGFLLSSSFSRSLGALLLSGGFFAPAQGSSSNALLDINPVDEGIEVELQLSSEDRRPAEVFRDAAPYKPGQTIETEMVALELGGFAQGIGEIILRERSDMISRGKIHDVETDPDGNLIGGFSTFNLFLEIELVDLGITLHTGNKSIEVTSGTITDLPPVGTSYDHEDYDPGDPVVLYNSSTLQSSGEVYYGNHHITKKERCDKIKCTVDLDVDSDNTKTTFDWPPDRTPQEDNIETNLPGRYVLVNDDDDDSDEIPDYVDGFNANNTAGDVDDVNGQENDFVRMVLEIPAPTNLNVADVRFTYSASDPAGASYGGNPPTATLAAGRLRVWKKNGNVARDKRDAAAGGDFVNSGVTYKATALGLGASSSVNLWLEGIRPSPPTGDLISVSVDPDGPGPKGFECNDAVMVTVLQLEFIDDSNTVIPKTARNARLMISNIITDRLTDAAAAGSFPRANVTFNGAPTNDPDNFRVELQGGAPGLTPQFLVDVLRPNNQVRNTFTYGPLNGAVGGNTDYRTDEQIRLVSQPGAGSDDGVGAAREPTRLARIDETLTNDRVRARVTIAGTAYEAELPICRPPAETHNPLAQETAIRTGDINFVTLAGAAHTTGTTITWVNRDWAQVCMRFRSAGVTANQVAVSNALVVSGTATGAGAVTVGIAGTNFNVAVAVGDNAQAVATNVATAIQAQAGLTGAAFRHMNDWMALVNRGTAVQPNFTTAPASTAAGITFTQPTLTYSGATDTVTLLEGAVLGLNYKDNDATTLDLFAINIPNILGSSNAATGYDALAPHLPGWENSVMHKTARLSPAAGNNTHTPGHELGHALFDVGNGGHSGLSTNLFNGPPGNLEPDINTKKRLDDAQNGEARTDSGPGSAGPDLLKQN